METNANITAAMFAAYLICRTQAYLTVHGEKLPDPVFAEMRNRVSAAYKALARQRLSGSTVPIDFSTLTDGVIGDGGTAFVDCETALYAIDGTSSASLDHRASRAGSDRPYVPILYSAWEKSDQSDDLLVCFGALAIAQATGAEIPPKGPLDRVALLRKPTTGIAGCCACAASDSRTLFNPVEAPPFTRLLLPAQKYRAACQN
jgi:hypothetical protein